MTVEGPAPLIVTLALDAENQARFDALRRAHFPPERNFLAAHLTLFHALPGDERASIEQTLAAEASALAPLTLQVSGLRSLGRGVAYVLGSGELQALHRRLASAFAPWLTPQDRQPLQPHVTVQNKVSPEEARALLAKLSDGFQPFACQGEALQLWHYEGGPWRHASRHPFAGDAGMERGR